MAALAYAMVRNGEVRADEVSAAVEREGATVVDVVLSWGEEADRTVLGVYHVAEGESLTLGEEDALPFAATKMVERKNGKTTIFAPAAPALAALRFDGCAREGGSIDLGEGHVAELTMGLFHLRFAVVLAPKKVPLAMRMSRSLVGIVLASAALHFGIVGLGSMFGSAMSQDDSGAERTDQRLLAAMVDAPQDPEQQKILADNGGGDSGGSSTAAAGQGTVGPQDAPRQPGKLSIAGDASKPQTLSRAQELQQASEFGIIGLVAMANAETPSGLNLPWGNDTNGSDQDTHLSSLLGGIDDSQGTGGLGLTGPGEGGNDGPGHWIGMGRIGQGTLGRCVGAECTDREHLGWGKGPGTGGAPKSFPIRFTGGTTQVNGHLPGDVIQRIIRQHQGAFANCYETGLRANPELSGRVGVRFMIDSHGAVSYVADAGSDLPDQSVRSCIVSQFRSLSFPAPEGGVVRVSYGLSLSPGTT